MLVLALSIPFFLALYALVARSANTDFSTDFKLLRGLASVLLTAIGLFALLHWWELWPKCFMAAHAGDAIANGLVLFITGHFIADFLLLAYGWFRHRVTPRPDLIAHHALGIFASGVVMHYQIGHALYLLLMITEIMPVTSGVTALGALLRRSDIELLGARLRLATLVLLRMPLWIVVCVLCWRALGNAPEPQLIIGYKFSLAFLVVVALLDSFWIGQCVKGLRRFPASTA